MGPLTTRRLMVWGIEAAIIRAYLVAFRRVHQHGRLRSLREAAKVRPLTRTETEDAARLDEELREATR